jgi:hypothetical protein
MLSQRWPTYLLYALLLYGCKASQRPQPPLTHAFGPPAKVQVLGYSGHLMEPFISRDGQLLLFNNLNAAPENTNLHWAIRVNDSVFRYQGEVTDASGPELDGVPSMDENGDLYFVSTRSYGTTLATIYRGRFQNGTVSNVQIMEGLSKKQPGWLNFDVEVSADGNTLYFVDGQFGNEPVPLSADLAMAQKTGNGFQRLSNSGTLLQHINTSDLEYAACISPNQLELYFTRATLPITACSQPVILYANRSNLDEPFGPPVQIGSIKGFSEAPTLAPDQRTLYYHGKDNGRHVLYCVRQ